MADKFRNQSTTLESISFGNGFSITPSDATVFSQATRAIYVANTGNLTVMLTDKNDSNNIVSFLAVPAGTILPIRAQRVYANSTATGLVGLY